ncbi:hypothetical protein G6F70_007946 [Rhizopus microsporus]|nr:hypothetical protein G6F71_004463 [Rhizopus microsporus]KAG1195811.1 hypothetical protein G6F70_007946 [Rhizopus microsporus]KAG1207658.1 hypothetical protein G6F69_007863 [Rhizopus microsporus]KAG1229183.1 hypothetical protein G6F67_007330 [Rhizopus microsporus]KAG1260592.1 hypothetical protein G6F68_007325 [Rhizopus microsporus]
MKKATFEAEARNFKENLQQRFDWFMQWKDSDLDFTRNCVFIDEAGFHINMRFNYGRSAAGTRARVKTEKTRSPSHTIIGAIHSGSVLFVQLKKPPSKKEILGQQTSKKRKTTNKGIKRAASPPPENKTNFPKGTTTAHFIKFINELLDVMDLDESLKGCYLVLDNASIHKSQPMIRKIEKRRYKLIHLPPYSPELNPIEQFWALVKRKLKRGCMMTEENLSSRIADACNQVLINDLYGFASHSKRQIMNCYNKTPM